MSERPLREFFSAREALAWMTECAFATIEGMPKSTSKYERERQRRIADTGVQALLRFDPEGEAVASAKASRVADRIKDLKSGDRAEGQEGK